MLGGPNMKLLSGLDVQVSGIACRVSDEITARALPLFSASSATLAAERRFWRLRWAICRAAGILLPDHIQAYFSAFLWFCLSRRA